MLRNSESKIPTNEGQGLEARGLRDDKTYTCLCCIYTYDTYSTGYSKHVAMYVLFTILPGIRNNAMKM